MTNDILESEVLAFDRDHYVNQISNGIRASLRKLRKRGLVIAISGGIDSSVSAALCVKAIGEKKVFGLLLPETDSSSESASLGRLLANHLGVEFKLVDISPILKATDCYAARDAAMQRTLPEYEPNWKSKIIISGGQQGIANHFKLVAQSPEGIIREAKMNLPEYLQIVAATNYKQRVRKMVEYFHADRLNYAVVGTPNRLEYDQGFFVKNGDGSADIKPIAHLYKSQVYALAKHLGLPDEICNTIPTTDTYSLPQGQDEFYFSLPYRSMDVALWCFNNGKDAKALATALGIDEEAAQNVYRDIKTKRRTTAPLHWPPLTIERIEGPIVSPDTPLYES